MVMIFKRLIMTGGRRGREGKQSMRCSLSVCKEENKGALMSRHFAPIVLTCKAVAAAPPSCDPTHPTSSKHPPVSQQTTALLTFAAQNMAPRSSDPLQVYLSVGPQCSQHSQYVLAGSVSKADVHMVCLSVRL